MSMSELVAGLMSFRGELQKVDVLTTKKAALPNPGTPQTNVPTKTLGALCR